MNTTEMKTEPIQTMNITGFRISTRGSSFTKAIPDGAAQDGKAPQFVSLSHGAF